MTIVFEQYAIAQRGKVELNICCTFEIEMTAEEARRKVHFWLLDEVSSMMGAEPPTLTINDRAVWRVPVHFSVPHLGTVGIVGVVDVDVQTGEISDSAACKAVIEQQATQLATRLPPYQPLRTISDIYIPKHIPLAPILKLPEDPQPMALVAGD